MLLGIEDQLIRSRDGKLKKKCKSTDDNIDSDFCFDILQSSISELELQIKEKEQLLNPSRPNPKRRAKINLNFYFHFSLLCLKRFYEGFHKSF